MNNFYFYMNTRTLYFLGKVKECGIITSYTEKVMYFFIEWGLFRSQGMPKRVNHQCLKIYFQSKMIYRDNKTQQVGDNSNDNYNNTKGVGCLQAQNNFILDKVVNLLNLHKKIFNINDSKT